LKGATQKKVTKPNETATGTAEEATKAEGEAEPIPLPEAATPQQVSFLYNAFKTYLVTCR
jgi:hypothetical protein